MSGDIGRYRIRRGSAHRAALLLARVPALVVLAAALSTLALAAPAWGHHLDGAWAGTTAQGKDISFTVANDVITALSFGGKVTGPGCTTDFTTSITNMNRPITNDAFSFSGGSSAPGSISFSISGVFDTLTHAGGNLSFQVFGIPGVPSCPGSAGTTWTATGGGGGGGDGGGGNVPPVPGSPIFDSQYPDFRFWVRIGGGTPQQRLGTWEPLCIPETVCVSGALPGRSEVFVRIVGPRPNGYLWPTIVKFTTSRIEVWIDQLSTGEIRYYDLAGAAPGVDELPGLFDRLGFLP